MKDCLDRLRALGELSKAEKMRAYHKTDREVWGISNPEIDSVVKSERKTPEADLALAHELWASEVLEARIMAGKLLTRGKLSSKMDEAYWRATLDYAPDFDGWAIADHMAMAAHKRVLVSDTRYLELQNWTHTEHIWRKRAVLVYTLPFARLTAPNEAQQNAIETILNWAAEYTQDPEWFIQKSVSWWLRERSKRDAKRVMAFLERHGDAMKAFARKDASKFL